MKKAGKWVAVVISAGFLVYCVCVAVIITRENETRDEMYRRTDIRKMELRNQIARPKPTEKRDPNVFIDFMDDAVLVTTATKKGRYGKEKICAYWIHDGKMIKADVTVINITGYGDLPRLNKDMAQGGCGHMTFDPERIEGL